MKKRQIFFIGYRATGKSTVGAIIAKFLGWEFIDLDRYIEFFIGKPIRRIFSDEGEEVFRDIESECLSKVVQKEKIVVSTGGGIVVREANRKILRDGIVLLLKSSIATIVERMKKDSSRPQLTNMSLEEEVFYTFKLREKYYDEVKDLDFENENILPEDLAKNILISLKENFKDMLKDEI